MAKTSKPKLTIAKKQLTIKPKQYKPVNPRGKYA